MADSMVLDRQALANLLAMTGDDPLFLAELIDAYADDAPAQLATMHRAVRDGDMGELRRAAHSLKANSANFGAVRLAELCARIEALATTGTPDMSVELVAMAEAEYDRVRRALQDARAGG
jgi:two-component system, sensor histidine kinase and response regulator